MISQNTQHNYFLKTDNNNKKLAKSLKFSTYCIGCSELCYFVHVFFDFFKFSPQIFKYLQVPSSMKIFCWKK